MTTTAILETTPSTRSIPSVSPQRQSRRQRLAIAGAATLLASAVYSVASAAGVQFLLTDPGKTGSMHLILAQIVQIAAAFALLGWGSLALLERYASRPAASWRTLALALIHLSVAGVLISALRPATRRA